ncbi:helix-turn-helix domain-containing protein [Pseudomonas aeruginosa]|jgi:excisionase family DNA binding protein|uniref:helix-turn-helix transcriptional regulator n=1 Tax=Pseudomonadota TaxID=1224 RepID=UPI0012DA441D|nr:MULTISPECIES: helix-turn-helix domain-containing protein [Pseudomonadota]MCG9065029.1 helix-turn-helix domain-containing protein [Laribacter hongkongensis]MDI2515652.1 helix-turn-helix domain-containing protein [Pseudomonas aeruginosa]MDI2528225.1 helix-turn-helix domain-containing protein [Pseudomonas aeruginosa]MDQ4683090.1 helix-turn-helix domain-containing protein [Stenotrophomonas maltophilia group sp. RNC7]MUI28089.1 helix-turn-helix domain-containing protein [Pseudomonas aeruginosa]
METRELLTREQVAQLLAELQQNVFTTEEAAHYLRLSRQTLELLRLQGGGPRYAKLGRSVRYRRAALDEWLAANEQNHTAEGAQ